MLRFSRIRAPPHGGVGGAAVAEQPLEHRPRVVLHRQRRGGRAPRDRLGVGAAQAGGALPGVGFLVDRELQRGERRRGAELAREHLVDRRVGHHVGLGRSAAPRAGQERARRARMDVGPRGVEPREDEHPVAERRQGLQDRRQLEAASHRRRRPVLHRHAVRHEDRLEAANRLDGDPPQPRTRRAPWHPETAAPRSAPTPRRTFRRARGFAVMMLMPCMSVPISARAESAPPAPEPSPRCGLPGHPGESVPFIPPSGASGTPGCRRCRE